MGSQHAHLPDSSHAWNLQPTDRPLTVNQRSSGLLGKLGGMGRDNGTVPERSFDRCHGARHEQGEEEEEEEEEEGKGVRTTRWTR